MLEKYIGDRAFLRRVLAVALPIMIQQAIMPFNAYTTSAYFTLRSGGKTAVTFLFDSSFVWCVIVPLYACCQATDLVKYVLGRYMIRRGSWNQNLAR